MNLSTGSSSIGIVAEFSPEMVESFVIRLGTGIKENTNFRLELSAESIEKPSVRIDLLLILLLENEDELNRDQLLLLLIILVRSDQSHSLLAGEVDR